MKTIKIISIILVPIIIIGYVTTKNHFKRQREFALKTELTLDSVMHMNYGSHKKLFSDETFKVRIACIGNSITQGSHLANPKEDCYPSQLNRKLKTKYGDTCIVKNYGLSGRTMLKNGSNPIWDEDKFHQAIDWKPDICFILLGTNDSRPTLWENSGNEFLLDYLAMIDTFKTRNPHTKFIIGAPTPIWEGHRYGGDTWEQKHNDSIMVNSVIPKIKAVSEKTGAVFIDFHTPFENSRHLFPDLLHPNATGANLIAKKILETIEAQDLIRIIKKNKTN